MGNHSLLCVRKLSKYRRSVFSTTLLLCFFMFIQVTIYNVLYGPCEL
jgi:hypothetical protein